MIRWAAERVRLQIAGPALEHDRELGAQDAGRAAHELGQRRDKRRGLREERADLRTKPLDEIGRHSPERRAHELDALVHLLGGGDLLGRKDHAEPIGLLAVHLELLKPDVEERAEACGLIAEQLFGEELALGDLLERVDLGDDLEEEVVGPPQPAVGRFDVDAEQADRLDPRARAEPPGLGEAFDEVAHEIADVLGVLSDAFTEEREQAQRLGARPGPLGAETQPVHLARERPDRSDQGAGAQPDADGGGEPEHDRAHARQAANDAADNAADRFPDARRAGTQPSDLRGDRPHDRRGLVLRADCDLELLGHAARAPRRPFARADSHPVQQGITGRRRSAARTSRAGPPRRRSPRARPRRTRRRPRRPVGTARRRGAAPPR